MKGLARSALARSARARARAVVRALAVFRASHPSCFSPHRRYPHGQFFAWNGALRVLLHAAPE